MGVRQSQTQSDRCCLGLGEVCRIGEDPDCVTKAGLLMSTSEEGRVVLGGKDRFTVSGLGTPCTLSLPLLLFSCWVVSDSFVTPWIVALQAPLSMEFLRQDYWGGWSFPSPGDLLPLCVLAAQSCLTILRRHGL